MTTTTQDRSSDRLAGRVSVVSGVLALAAVGWVAFLTYGSTDIPDVVRMIGAAFWPVGVGGALGGAIVGRHGPGRGLAVLGLGLGVAAVVAMLVLVAVAS